MAAIVEEDYVSAADLLAIFSFDHGGWRRVPVVSGHIPHDWFKAQFARDAQGGGAAAAEWRTEEIGVISNRILYRARGTATIPGEFGRALEGQ